MGDATASQRVTTSHNESQRCHFTMGFCTMPLPIESQLLRLPWVSWLQRVATSHKAFISPRVPATRHATWRHTCSGSGASGTRRVTTSRHIVRLLWVSAPHHFPSSPNCFDCIGLLGHSACQRFTRSCFHQDFRSRSMLHGVALAHAHGASGAFPTFLLLVCPCLRWVARWAGPLGSCGRVGLRPDGLQRVTTSHKVPDPRGKCAHGGARAGLAWVRFQLFFSSLVLASAGSRVGQDRWAHAVASACVRMDCNESQRVTRCQIPEANVLTGGRGLGSPGCVSNFSSPRLSLPPLGRALGRTAGLMRSRRPASGWIATSQSESQGARSPRQMYSRGGAGWARLGAFPTFLLLALPVSIAP